MTRDAYGVPERPLNPPDLPTGWPCHVCRAWVTDLTPTTECPGCQRELCPECEAEREAVRCAGCKQLFCARCLPLDETRERLCDDCADECRCVQIDVDIFSAAGCPLHGRRG